MRSIGAAFSVRVQALRCAPYRAACAAPLRFGESISTVGRALWPRYKGTMPAPPSEGIRFVDEPVVVDDGPIVDAEVLAPHGQPCDVCGAPIEQGDKFCTHCGRVAQDAKPRAASTRGSAKQNADLVIEGPKKHIECQSCGAHIKVDPDERSYACPFCDSTYVVEHTEATTGRQPPEFVIGFAVTHDQALQKFRNWLADNSFWRPGDLSQAKIEEKLRGVYLPFWRFTMRSQSRWSARIGEYWYRTETYYTTDSNGKRVRRTRRVRETEWWPLAGQHHMYHRDYLVSGSRGLPQSQADRIKPFNLPALKRYDPSYIAGWITEEYSIELQPALQICQQEFRRRESHAIAAFLPGDTHRQLQVRTRFSQATSDLILLPVYLLSYRYQDKLYRFIVNGQTGKIAGDKPWSSKRIWSAVGIGVGLLVAIVVILLIVSGVLSANG